MLLNEEYDADEILRDKFDEDDPILKKMDELDFENTEIDPFMDIADDSGDAADSIEP